MITNFKRLISTKSSSDNLKCIHGLRFLSITWVVMGHSYFFPGWFIRSYRALFLIENVATEPVAQMIINGSEAVDTFFFMSGLLICYFTLKLVRLDKKKFNLKLFILHRLWRIAPVYYFILLFATLIPLMGSGPLFNETMEEFVNPCGQYWWRNVLFINNYFHLKDMCMIHTWYVSCDFQLYLASLIVILPLLKSEKIGVAINIVLIGVSVIYTGILTYVGQIIPTVIMTMPDPIDRNLGYLYTYGNTLSRGGPYFIGILTGYLLFKYPEAKIPKIFQVFGWCLSILSSGLIVFITGAWYRIRPPTPLEVLMYATFYKVAFTSGVAWMTFCCITGRGGILNKFLSWKVWIPLGKLVFLIYLIQPIFQTLFIANFRSTQEYTHLFFTLTVAHNELESCGKAFFQSLKGILNPNGPEILAIRLRIASYRHMPSAQFRCAVAPAIHSMDTKF
ncbi:nose resistant to fluoxetine protein 6 [Trichonephila clavipes]|nr:nose resistant to fluoxetine protein 6 [Trichonephila clavipes]